jgi:hypothetical protein
VPPLVNLTAPVEALVVIPRVFVMEAKFQLPLSICPEGYFKAPILAFGHLQGLWVNPAIEAVMQIKLRA